MLRAIPTLIFVLAAQPVLTKAPVLMEEILPLYPEEVAEEGIEGDVLLRIGIDEDGVVDSVEVVESLHPLLDAAAVEAGWRMQFVPAEIDGVQAAIAIDYRFHFKLIEADAPEPEPEPEVGEADAGDLVGHETVVIGRKPWREVERAPLQHDASAVSGSWELTRRDIELAPGAMGDVAKVVGQLPGVVSDTDMFALFHVRGGDATETAFYLDDVELLNPNHLGGTFTMFNPKLTDRVKLYADAPPAPWRDSLAGSLDVHYIDGSSEEVDGIIDLNMAMGSAHVSGPLGPKGSPATFLLSARRSFFEAYFALLRAVGLFSDQFVGMAFGEYLGRVTVGGERHRLRFTLLHAHDHMTLASPDGDEEDAVVVLENGIDTRARTTLAALDSRWRLHDDVTWRNLVYFTHDFENRLQDADFEVSREIRTWRPGFRSDLELRVGETHHVRAGVDLAYFSVGGDGTIKDPRTTPTWAALPWANLGAPSLTFDSSRAWTELALYLEDDWEQLFGTPINVRSGVRVTPLHNTGEVLVSPRMGASVTAPTMTTFKAGWAVVHQPLREPLLFDPDVGAEDLRAERALHLSTGVQQLLPFGGLIRVEAYHRVLDRLLVNPDTRAAVERGPAYASIGTGKASGIDVFFAMRRGRVGLAVTYSLLTTERTNPLNEAGPKTFAPAWDQRHGLRVMGEVKIGRKRNWLIAGMWELRSGRPRTPVTPIPDLDGRGGWHVVPEAYNSESYNPWTELSLRFEHFRVIKERVKLAVYLDVLNATYAQGQFVWIYGAGEDGEPPEPYIFRQLPIRPWIGVRAEF